MRRNAREKAWSSSCAEEQACSSARQSKGDGSTGLKDEQGRLQSYGMYQACIPCIRDKVLSQAAVRTLLASQQIKGTSESDERGG